MNRKTKPAEKPKQKSNLKEPTAMKTVITSNSSLLTILRSRSALILIALALGTLALVHRVEAVNPPPDGGYPGGNTAEGQAALLSLSTGGFNTAVGFFSLRSNTAGQLNTATGAGALFVNTADQNTATGAGALLSNTTGTQNTANGTFALFSNTEGPLNTANGFEALFSNTTGSSNTANGYRALPNSTTSNANTAIGFGALENNTTGNFNTSLGAEAGFGVTTADNVICIGAQGANVSSSCFIGHIRGVTTANPDAIPVMIDDAGQLGTMSSSRRFKKEIKPMDNASETILALKPVTFHYKSDASGTPQFGLIAEEVAEVNPDLVVRNKDGEIYTVRYEQVNAMLLNEFLKEHHKVQELEKQVEKLTAGLQKVSAQLETSKPAPEVVNNP